MARKFVIIISETNWSFKHKQTPRKFQLAGCSTSFLWREDAIPSGGCLLIAVPPFTNNVRDNVRYYGDNQRHELFVQHKHLLSEEEDVGRAIIT